MTSSILVTDTNIWIDLDHGGLIEEVFHLPCRIYAPDFARKEMRSVDPRRLEETGLVFQELDQHLVAELYSLAQANRQLSLTDLAAFVLAKKRRSILVSGDRRLIHLAHEARLETHGVLWLLDELLQLDLISPARALAALQAILSYNERLPRDECEKRLRAWAGKGK